MACTHTYKGGAPLPYFDRGVGHVFVARALCLSCELVHWELTSGLGLGPHHVRRRPDHMEKAVGIAVLASLFVLRVCHHEIVPGKPWSIFQRQHALHLRTMTNQVEHKGKVKMAKTRKAASSFVLRLQGVNAAYR